MKAIFTAILFLFVSFVNAAPAPAASAPRGESKMVLCMDMSMLAAEAYDDKVNGVTLSKIRAPGVKYSAVFRELRNEVVTAGFAAKSRKQAIEDGYAVCVESEFWAEMTKK